MTPLRIVRDTWLARLETWADGWWHRWEYSLVDKPASPLWVLIGIAGLAIVVLLVIR